MKAIIFDVETETATDLNPVCFSSNLFKEILVANKDADQGYLTTTWCRPLERLSRKLPHSTPLVVPVGAYHFTFIISDPVFARHRNKTDHSRLFDNMTIVGLMTSSEGEE